jgi:sialate O-acetylesterase
MRQTRYLGAVLSGLLLIAGPMPAAVKLASVFGEHMVLQQGVPVPVWGTAAPGERVTVTLGGQRQTATAGADGKWMVHLAALKAGGPFRMTVAGKNKLTLSDVYAGEVWLGSGQSNMDMTVAREDRYWCGVVNEAEEIASANYPLIRMFKVKLRMTDEPQAEAQGQWVVASPQTVGRFSATAYFFGRELYRKLQAPIGLIDSSYGASAAQAWISHKALEANPDLTFLLNTYATAKREFAGNHAAREKFQQELANWEPAAAKAKAEGRDAPRRPRDPDPGHDQHNPCVLYNGMIAPLVPYAIRGAIWYQGESNGPTAKKYLNIMDTLIRDWRQAWGQGDFPFLFVQLASLNTLALQPQEGGWIPQVREGQLQTLTVKNTGMAVAIDIGDAANVHPKNKQDVGRRLALAARALVYGESIPYSGPIYASMSVEGGAVRLRFKHTEGGLTAAGGTPIGFAVAGADRKFVWGDAKIDGDAVVVSNPEVMKPVAVRYGWADNPPVNLYNKAGLPASPFRTDNW